MRAVCYLRFVRELSLEAQQRTFLDECARAGLEVGPTFTETAAGAEAPEFRHMLRSLLGESAGHQRGFTVIVVANLLVLGATVREQARRYLQLEALGLPLRIPGGGDVDAALLAAWPRRPNAERRRDQVRTGMRERALRGEVLGRAPYGYRVVSRHLHVEPAESEVVRAIFRHYLDDGEGIRIIARRLNEAGLRTRRGGPWSMGSVREVLRNAVYVGTYRRLGVTVPTEHEPLLTRDRFAAVQQRLAARRTSFGKQERREYLLAGLATCGHCGASLIGLRRRSRARVVADESAAVHTYYQCESSANRGGCAYRTRRSETIEDAVRAALEAPQQGGTPGDSPLRGEVVESTREGLRRRLDALLERRMRGEWTADQLRQQAGSLALEDLQAEERAEFVARQRADGVNRRQHAEDRDAKRGRLAAEWDALAFGERRRLLQEVVASIVVTNAGIEIVFRG